MKIVFVFLILIFTLVLTCKVQLSSQYNLQWDIDSSNGIINFQLNISRIGWVGIGFHPVGSASDPGMVLADLIVCNFDDNGKVTVNDYYSSTFERPSPDTSLGGTDDIISFSGSQVGGNTLVSFSRKIVTSDQYDTPFTMGPMKVIWAIGSSNTFGYHGYELSNRGEYIVSFFDNDVCGPTKGCSACNSKSQCIFCGSDSLCYDKTNIGKCQGLNSTCLKACDNELPNAWVPDGFCASIWASGLNRPRGIISVSNADILVVEAGKNQVTVMWEENNTVLTNALANAQGLNHGVAVYGDFLYASNPTTVFRWRYTVGMRNNLGAPQTVVFNIPCCHHSTRSIVFDKDGNLYVSVGSASNVDPDSTHARIHQFNISNIPPTGVDWNVGYIFADGLRNEVGLGFDADNRLWGVENGCDQLNRPDLGGDIHNNNPSEEVNLFQDGGKFYGYPYCWTEYDLPVYGKGRGTQWVHPDFMGDGIHSDEWCQNTNNVVVPAYNMGAHQAPLGILFYYGTSFPSMYNGGAFVALHGSWNRQPPAGYSVIHISMQNGVPVAQTDVLKNNGNSAVWPNNVRPVSLTLNKCDNQDCLFITSDASGQIIKLIYQG